MQHFSRQSTAMVSAPHFQLVTEAHSDPHGGRWRFALRQGSGRVLLEAADIEPGLAGPRLELLAAVRGLEAIEQPARVTLLTSSAYVRRGMDHGIENWRASDWEWEWFGQMVPIRNRDLWQRIDRALTYHQVQCRRWRIDAPHRSASSTAFAAEPRPARSLILPHEAEAARVAGPPARPGRRLARAALGSRRWLAERAESVWTRARQMGTGLVPAPWME